MIDRLLPSQVCVVAARGDDPDAAAALFPEERALIEGAVASRSAEFATARDCAHRTLRLLGVDDGPILRGPKREPLWPTGVVGSITHCTGYRAAAAARAAEFLTVGIDAEPHQAISARVTERIAVAAEREWMARAPAGVHWDRVIFSAKESVYKAWFPLTQSWLGFEEAEVAIDPAAGSFRARLLIDPPVGVPREFLGRFLVAGGLVLTAISVRRG